MPVLRKVLLTICRRRFLNQGWIEKVKRRVVDLLKAVQNFSYYHPEQHGFSLDQICPAGVDRTQLRRSGDSGGRTASLEFLRVHFGTCGG